MNRIKLFFQIAFLLVAGFSLAETKTAKTTSEYVLIKIKSEQINFAEGEKVKIPALIKNTSDEKVHLFINRWDKFYGFPINLKNEKCEEINVRGKHPQIGGNTVIELAPKEEYRPIFEFENLVTGVYQFDFEIAFGIRQNTIEESENFIVKSSTFTFSVDVKK